MKKSTIAETTKVDYMKTGIWLLNRFIAEHNINGDPNYLEFVDWLESMKPTIGSATWRQYKSATMYLFNTYGLTQPAEKLFKITSLGTKKNGEMTSANKKKHILIDEEQKIRETLTQKVNIKDKYAKDCLPLFEAMLVVGLRPSEFQYAELIDTAIEDVPLAPPLLKVKNAKATNGRSFGEYRIIGLDGVDERAVLYIRLAIVNAKTCTDVDGNFIGHEKWLKALQDKWYNTFKVIFPNSKKRISLYSARHQCIADLKALDYSLPEIAAIVGHGNDITASKYYGKKRHGITRTNAAKPNPADVDAIRRVKFNPHTSPAPQSIVGMNVQ